MVRLVGPMDVPRTQLQLTRRTVTPPVDESGRVIEEFGKATTEILQTARRQQIENEVLDADLRTRQDLEKLRGELAQIPPNPDGSEPDLRAVWDERSAAVVAEHAQRMTSPLHQRAWNERMGNTLLQEGAEVTRLQQQRTVEHARAGIYENYARAIAVFDDEDATPVMRAEARRVAQAAIDGGLQSRSLGADDVARLQSELTAKALAAEEGAQFRDLSRVVQTNPRAARAQLQGFIEHPETIPAEYGMVSQANMIAQFHTADGIVRQQEAEARARAAQVEAAYRDRVRSDTDHFQLTGQLPGPPLNIDELARVTSPAFAESYSRTVQEASLAAGMQGMSNAQIAQRVNTPIVGTPEEQVTAALTARAAATIQTARARDPMGTAITHGQVRAQDLINIIGGGNVTEVTNALNARGADAVHLRDRGQMDRALPLSVAEAAALSTFMDGLTDQDRTAFLDVVSHSMNNDAYNNMMRQMGDVGGPVIAYAGFTHQRNPTVAARLYEGRRLLRGADPVTEGGPRRPLIQMPNENALHNAWVSLTSSPRGDGVGVVSAYSAMIDGEAMSYEVFRAAYAERLSQRGPGSDPTAVDEEIAGIAMATATGGLINWNNRATIMPAGTSQAAFNSAVRQAFDDLHLGNVDIEDYDIVAIGEGRYRVDGLRDTGAFTVQSLIAGQSQPADAPLAIIDVGRALRSPRNIGDGVFQEPERTPLSPDEALRQLRVGSHSSSAADMVAGAG